MRTSSLTIRQREVLRKKIEKLIRIYNEGSPSPTVGDTASRYRLRLDEVMIAVLPGQESYF